MTDRANQLQYEIEGRNAFDAGRSANDCPYCFIATPCWANKDYNRFDAEYRWKLDAWMKGWINARDRSRGQ